MTDRIVLLALLLATGCPEEIATETGESPPVPGEITAYAIGEPTWEIDDWVIASVPMGTRSSSWEAYRESLVAIFPDHEFPSGFKASPGPRHEGPYDHEASDGVAAAGFPAGWEFEREAWMAPQGLVIAGTMVPTEGAPTGPGFDYDDGPVIDDHWLKVDGDLEYEGKVVDAEFDGTIPDYASSYGPDGYRDDDRSHIPINFGESTEFIGGEAGNYVFAVEIVDGNTGTGWRYTIPFRITR